MYLLASCKFGRCFPQCMWVVQNLGLASGLIAAVHIHNHVHVWLALLLSDISDLCEAWRMLEFCLPSRLIVARRLEILIERIVKRVSFNPFLPSASLISHVGEANVLRSMGTAFWCGAILSIGNSCWFIFPLHFPFLEKSRRRLRYWGCINGCLRCPVTAVLLICFYRAVYSKRVARWIFYWDFRWSKEYFPVY